jgi:hypothetical protein
MGDEPRARILRRQDSWFDLIASAQLLYVQTFA